MSNIINGGVGAVLSNTQKILLVDISGNSVSTLGVAGVSSINSLTGAATIAGLGNNTVTVAGQTISVSGVTTTGSAPISVTAGVVSISTATTSTNGSLTSTDWNTFNNKQPSGTYNTTIATSGLGVSLVNTGGPAVTQFLNSISGLGTVSITGPTNGVVTISGSIVSPESTTASSSGTGFAVFNSQVGTNLIFNTISGLGTVTASSSNGIVLLSGSSFQTSTIPVTAPITNTAGTIGITTAATAANGSLTSTDWNTFNNKQASGVTLLLTGGTLSGVLNGTTINATTISGTTISGVSIFQGGSRVIDTVSSSGLGVSLVDGKTASTQFLNSISGVAGVSITGPVNGLITVSGVNTTTQTLADAATIAWNMANGINAKVTISGNRTMGTPTNMVLGQRCVLQITSDGTANRTIAWAAGTYLFGGGISGTKSSPANSVDYYGFYVNDASKMVFEGAQYNVS